MSPFLLDLPTLARHTKWHKRTEEAVKVDDAVVVADSSLPRPTLPRGRVTAACPGADGQVRVVDVNTHTGVLRHPVTKICVLDVTRESER